MRFRFRLVLADHLALCILTGNPGGSSPYRNIFSTIDMRQTHLSMACLSEFSVLSSSVKWIIIQAKFEQMYKGFTEILSQPNSCKEMVTISAIKKHQSSISSVYGMVCTHFILILNYCYCSPLTILSSRFRCSPLLIQVTNIPFFDLLPANVEFCPSSALWVPPNLHNTAKVITTNLNYQLNYVLSKDHPTISRLGRYLKCMQKSFCGECSKKTKLLESLSVCVLYACYFLQL